MYIIYVYVTFIHKFLSYISSQIIIFFTVCARHYLIIKDSKKQDRHDFFPQ